MGKQEINHAVEIYKGKFPALQAEVSENIPESVVRLTRAVHTVIDKYREIEGITGVPAIKAAKDIDEVVNREPTWTAETGVMNSGLVMTTLRDGAEKAFNAPKIRALIGQTREVDGQRLSGSCVEIGVNGDASTDFSNEVLPGVEKVRIWDNGFVEAYAQGESTTLSPEQTAELTAKFDRIANQVEDLLRKRR